MKIGKSGRSVISRLSPLSVPDVYEMAVRLVRAIAILGVVLLSGWWLTHLTAPRPVARMPTLPATRPDHSPKMLDKLFGSADHHAKAADGLQLVGVFSGSGGGGFATFLTPKGAMSVFVGKDVIPGVVLKRIDADRVTLVSAGVERELRLVEPGTHSSAPVVQAAAAPPPPVSKDVVQGIESTPLPATHRQVDRPREENQ